MPHDCPARRSRRHPVTGLRTGRSLRHLHELEAARRVHADILPARSERMLDLDLQALAVPASVVGGDFYDYFPLGDEHLAVVVADVSGKGISAAFHMAATRTLLRSLVPCEADPVRLVARLNALLCRDNEQMMFVTAFIGVLHVPTGLLRYVNAGHTPPVLRASGRPAALVPCQRNIALGVLEHADFAPDTLQLQSGDTVLLYTDGITEAVNPQGDAFGTRRLLDLVDRCIATGGELPHEVVSALRQFEAGRPQGDDVTCFALRRAYTV